MVATLGQMNEMTAVAERPDMVAISPKIAKTLLKILGGVAMAAKMAIGLVAHSVTGGVFLGDDARKMDREQDELAEISRASSASTQCHGHISPIYDEDDFIDGYYPRGR